MRKLLSLCLALCMAFTLASPALAEGALAEAPLDGAAAEPAAAPLDAPKLAAGTIYFDGAKGNDTNNGLTSDAPVKTIGKAMELAGAGGTVKLLSTIAVGAGQTILVKDVTVIREDGFQDTMFSVTVGGTLTLENATVDGNGEAGYEAIYVGGGTLNLHEGAAVQNNVSEFGSAVYAAGGVVNMAGGVIQDNAATADGGFGGLFVENAVLNMTGGAITGNKAVNSIGAGVLLLSGAKATVTGGEIAGNFAQFPNDGGLLEIEQAIAVLGQDALTLNGDARISGRVFLESGFKILVEQGFAPPQPIAIEASQNTVGTEAVVYAADMAPKAEDFTWQAMPRRMLKAAGQQLVWAETKAVTFREGSGDTWKGLGTQYVETGTTIPKSIVPQAPDKPGHAYAWYTWDGTTGQFLPWDFSSDTVDQDVTLYARYTATETPPSVIPDTGLALDQTALELEPGDTAKLKASLTPADATYKYIFWESSDETVATVSDSGLVTAIADGTATITAKSWYGHEAVCTVTVKTPDVPTPPEPTDPWPTEGLEGFVTRCYRVALGRDPDKAGHADWVRWLKDGTVDPATCTYGFVFSKEMNNKDLSDEDFVKTLYKLFMDREGEATGVAFWTEYLQDGHSREEVFYGFADSVEFGRIKAHYGIQ